MKQLADDLVKKWKGVAGKHKDSATAGTAGALNPAKRERSLTSTRTRLGYWLALKFVEGNEEGIAVGQGFGDLDGQKIGFSDTGFSLSAEQQAVKMFLSFVCASFARIADESQAHFQSPWADRHDDNCTRGCSWQCLVGRQDTCCCHVMLIAGTHLISNMSEYGDCPKLHGH